MGKRKTKRKPQKKLKEKLDTVFNCTFCNHENSIECKMDQQNKVGHLNCKICGVSWQTNITYLDEPVDVYSAWIDACEELNKRQRVQRARQLRPDLDNVDYGRRSTSPPLTLSTSRNTRDDDNLDRLDPFDDDEDDDDF
ncbi:transcription elongation factor Elf1 like-domain-containing protein [Mycotypha africana]|uniref:transcription elongation factor Elf1 like-domain-containing protein n=1 Tax=Mycotypha africana TaxID=64632 RepID=UPI00230066DC|nr:transcription elongation factor Elf1 like-domain-containing protein [Mycotypha africana]KAI8984665.1 transcription elongation factor Elf1 like-domain-containing protein [Mycotypha africana]